MRTHNVPPELAAEAQDWSLIPIICRRVEEAHAVIQRLHRGKANALPHIISSEVRFAESMLMFEDTGSDAYKFFLRNFDDRSMLWSILKFTGEPASKLCSRSRESLIKQIYNYGVEAMFDAAADSSSLAITNWTHLRRSGLSKGRMPIDHKMLVDYIKAACPRDAIVSVAESVFYRGTSCDLTASPGPRICTTICDHVVPHGAGALVSVPRDAMHKHVFLKIVNTTPEMRHLQHVAGSESSSNYITVNKLVDCVQLNDESIVFCKIDHDPIQFKLDAAFVPDCIQALMSLTVWKVDHEFSR